jgi:type I protein arginine methyltransferase
MTSHSGDDNNSSITGSDDGDDNWNDWVDDDDKDEQPVATRSLFDDRNFPNPQAAIDYDKRTHSFDLSALSARLGLPHSPPQLRWPLTIYYLALDTYQRLRLINYIRSQVSYRP